MAAPARHRRRALAAVAALWLAGCTTTVVPPASVAEPLQVGVVDLGRHTSLVLELPEGGMVRYAYGDWDWYALQKTGLAEGVAALFGPDQAALGRRRFAAPFSPPAIERALGFAVEDALYFAAEARDVRRLVARLDRVFAENAGAVIYTRDYDLEFVPYPEPYSGTNNSNVMVGRWLEELGCRIEGDALFARWRRG